MRTIDYSGYLTALSSIAHGGKDLGVTHTFRRESFFAADGNVIEIPVVSGSVIRGSLRRTAAQMMHEALAGDGRLPFTVVHAFMTGGSLRETRTGGEVVTGERQALLRSLVPMIGVFGVSGGGRIMSGRLSVDKAVPVTQQTAHLAEYHGPLPDGYTPPSVWSTVQRESYTRYADVDDSKSQPFIDVDAVHELPKGSGSMLWRQETVAMGVRFFHRLYLENALPEEVAFFDSLVKRWSRNAVIGGQKARGCGRVRCDYTRAVTNVAGDPADDESAVDWRAQVREKRSEILDVLEWL